MKPDKPVPPEVVNVFGEKGKSTAKQVVIVVELRRNQEQDQNG